MYEPRHRPPLSRAQFLRRFLRHLVGATAFLVGSLGLGVAGYMVFEDLSPVDAFLNAAMLLGGMGPVDPPQTEAGKIFAGAYALYAGLGVLIAAGILFAPIFHRLMHKFHWDLES
ncbi:MAG TPA: hypothetical protein VF017_06800 [Thermoanaerobaculia bacterium]|nr:hypothetical protein [Thermoanaerobaculia bacterium]